MAKVVKAVKAALGIRSNGAGRWFWVMYHNV